MYIAINWYFSMPSRITIYGYYQLTAATLYNNAIYYWLKVFMHHYCNILHTQNDLVLTILNYRVCDLMTNCFWPCAWNKSSGILSLYAFSTSSQIHNLQSVHTLLKEWEWQDVFPSSSATVNPHHQHLVLGISKGPVISLCPVNVLLRDVQATHQLFKAIDWDNVQYKVNKLRSYNEKKWDEKERQVVSVIKETNAQATKML